MKTSLSLLSLFLIVSCAGDSDNKSSSKNEKPQEEVLAELRSGSYELGCHVNRYATIDQGINVYSIIEFDLDDNLTGTITDSRFSDDKCDLPTETQVISVSNYALEDADGTNILKLSGEFDGVNEERFYPYKTVDNRIYFDVDFSDGQSGPYSVRPVSDAVEQFNADPVKDGIQFRKI